MPDGTRMTEPRIPRADATGIPGAKLPRRKSTVKGVALTTGLVLSATLIPLPATSPLVKPTSPRYENPELSGLGQAAVATRGEPDASLGAPELDDLAELLDNSLLALRTDTLLELDRTRGLPDAAPPLELLRSMQTLTRGHRLVLSGGDNAPLDVGTTALPQLVTLLDMLVHALPGSSGYQLSIALGELAPLIAQSLTPQGTPVVDPLTTKVFANPKGAPAQASQAPTASPTEPKATQPDPQQPNLKAGVPGTGPAQSPSPVPAPPATSATTSPPLTSTGTRPTSPAETPDPGSTATEPPSVPKPRVSGFGSGLASKEPARDGTRPHREPDDTKPRVNGDESSKNPQSRSGVKANRSTAENTDASDRPGPRRE